MPKMRLLLESKDGLDRTYLTHIIDLDKFPDNMEDVLDAIVKAIHIAHENQPPNPKKVI